MAQSEGSPCAPQSQAFEIVTLLLVILLLLLLVGVIYAQFILWMSIQCMKETFACLAGTEHGNTPEPLFDVPNKLGQRFRRRTSSMTDKQETMASVIHPCDKTQALPKTSPCPPLSNGSKNSSIRPGNLEWRKSGNHLGLPFSNSIETQSSESLEHEYESVVPDLKNTKKIDAILSTKRSKTPGSQNNATTELQEPKKQTKEDLDLSKVSLNSVYDERKRMEKNESTETVEV
ncbi:uncharacterized protein LOC143023999 isoform X2 [Oratosquilla oratoria]|uniref:uncharacterized protein LOC143023999 isoform X2 n=1 Tax=Oratosquilla oratoria TaxID=337810 RepID=UPI003F76B6F6